MPPRAATLPFLIVVAQHATSAPTNQAAHRSGIPTTAFLSETDRANLRALTTPGGDISSIHSLADFLARPEIQRELDALLAVRDIQHKARIQAATTKAIESLEKVIDDSADPIETRRAATAILRITREPRQRWSTRRAPARLAASAASAPPPTPESIATGPDTDNPGSPIPPHFRRIEPFIHAYAPARGLTVRQAISNALALLRHGDPASLASLFKFSSGSARYGATEPHEFIRECHSRWIDVADFDAAWTAPPIRDRNLASQQVILTYCNRPPVIFVMHLINRSIGDREGCWLISRYTAPNPPNPPPNPPPDPSPGPQPGSDSGPATPSTTDTS